MEAPERIFQHLFNAPTPAITAAPAAPWPTAGALVARSWADPQDCVDDYRDSASHCNSLQSTVDKCATRLDGAEASPENGPFARCFCEPSIFTGLVECQNQHRECLRDFAMDPQFSHFRSQWQDFCSSASPDLTYETPALVTPEPITSFKNGCSYIKSACNRYNHYTSGCQSSFTDQLSECYCQAHIVSMESVCSVDGVAMCSKQPIGDVGSLWGVGSCRSEVSFTVPEWAMAEATVDVPTTVPFADFPMTYNDIPTISSGVQDESPNIGLPGVRARLKLAIMFMSLVAIL